MISAQRTWWAPGRVNLIGEHTDYNDGFVLPLAIGMGVFATVRPASDGMLRMSSAQHPAGAPTRVALADLAPGTVQGWPAFIAGVFWALAERGHQLPGADVKVDGDVPLGAGLSSSAALECSVAAAAADAFGLELDRADLVRLTQRSENVFVGVPNGIMDQSASILATSGHALFLDTRTWHYEQVPFTLSNHGLSLLVVDSRAPHALVDSEYAARRRSCEAAAAILGVNALRDIGPGQLSAALLRIPDQVMAMRVRHVVTENERVLRTVELLRSGDPRRIGPVLSESHVSMRDDFQITVPEVDLAMETALRAGAYGARMTGGGFGGCVIALVERDDVDSVVDAIRQAFAVAGFKEPAAFLAHASSGAHRVAHEPLS